MKKAVSKSKPDVARKLASSTVVGRKAYPNGKRLADVYRGQPKGIARSAKPATLHYTREDIEEANRFGAAIRRQHAA